MFIHRSLDLDSLLTKKSHFLLGPRGTGKTKLIQHSIAKKATIIDLLDDDRYSRLLRRPALLSELLPRDTKWVVIDEVQKIPALLDEVHRLIEKNGFRFLLTGSSARKLKRGGANLLGGRAWEARLFGLSFHELGKSFDLTRYLNRGGLPSIYFSDFPEDELKNYIKLYLREEIQAEAIVKKLDHFVRFLDASALTNGREINFEAIGNDAGVPSRTVASYYEILEDTLLGFQLPPFLRSKKRKAIKTSKFYFFDVGVAGALAQRGEIKEKSELFGHAFEHFMIQEIRAYLHYRNLNQPMSYWRATSQMEVDLIIGAEAAIEFKSTERISPSHLKGLKAFREEKLVAKYYIVSLDRLARQSEGVIHLHWRDFLTKLWLGAIFK